jgi:phenylpyruvate tautomerase PptA (4-oxalocrotonate tautomerase family)
MPICTITTNTSTFTADNKAQLAGEIATMREAINHVPSTYVNAIFHELPIDNVFTDGAPACPVLLSGWVRQGHADADTTLLATELTGAITRITGIGAERVLVVMQNSSAHFAVDGGRVLPESGEEQAWSAGH